MSQQVTAGSGLKLWLLSRSGRLAGTRIPISEGTFRVGRAPDNDAVISGADSATVSLYHFEISWDAVSCRVRDLDSTNGTWVNGERITQAEITLPAVIQLGNQGPEFSLVLEEAAPEELNRTVEIPAATVAPVIPASPIAAHENLLTEAVARARRIRAHGIGGQTMTIMRDVIEQALRHTRRRLRLVGVSLLTALVTVSALGTWKIVVMKGEKRGIDAHIQELEAALQKSTEVSETDRLLSRLNAYQDQAESLRRTLLFRIGGGTEDGDYVTQQLRAVMAEFGAEVYSIPPEFIERVNHYIELDQGSERPIIERALGQAHTQLQTIRRILREEQLPADLAYIPLVESALTEGPASAAGAVGPWQLTAPTAKNYGLRVDGEVDERKNLVSSTRASCKYLRDLILDFGAGSSVMLALAAYNSGTSKVKQAVTRTVRDPIKQRNFWYLYRVRALPLETREYVPKVFAVILIGRNPAHFGF